MSVLDSGANHGLYTLLAARCAGANGCVFVSPREHKRLRRLQADSDSYDGNFVAGPDERFQEMCRST